MKTNHLVFVCLLATGCNETPHHTKSEFLHNPQLMETTVQMCRQDPAKARKDDNCINAFSANETNLIMRELSTGNCFKNGVDHACLEAKGYKQP